MRGFAAPVLLTLSLLVLSPPIASAAEPPAHRVNGDLAIQSRDIFARYCAECHTGSDKAGQSKLKLLDHKQLTAKGRTVPFVSPERSQVLELIKDGSMPPANRPGPTPAEIAVLERWVKAGIPGYPESFDERFTLRTVADNLDTANANKNYRYVSFAHLIRDGQPLPNLVDAEWRLNAALSLVTGEAVRVEPVDPTATVFCIDLGKVGLWTRELFQKVERRKDVGAVALQPFDLVLLEYPHAATLPSNGPYAKRLEKFLSPKSQARPVAFIRGDWLTSALATDGKLMPLAEDIKSLAALEKAIASGMPELHGPRFPRTLGTAPPFIVQKFTDGRIAIPPLSGWYLRDVAPDPAPFTMSAELVAGGQPVKTIKVDQRFKLKVQSDRSVYLTLLMVQADGEVLIQEIEGGGFLKENTPRELAPGAAGFQISGIITGGDSATEYFVLFASETELPLPTVVRSKHNERKVWRFLLEPSEKEPFDPNKVVRKVIAIPLSK